MHVVWVVLHIKVRLRTLLSFASYAQSVSGEVKHQFCPILFYNRSHNIIKIINISSYISIFLAITVKNCPIFLFLARFQAAYDDTSEALKLQPEFPDALRCQQQAKIDGKLWYFDGDKCWFVIEARLSWPGDINQGVRLVPWLKTFCALKC